MRMHRSRMWGIVSVHCILSSPGMFNLQGYNTNYGFNDHLPQKPSIGNELIATRHCWDASQPLEVSGQKQAMRSAPHVRVKCE